MAHQLCALSGTYSIPFRGGNDAVLMDKAGALGFISELLQTFSACAFCFLHLGSRWEIRFICQVRAKGILAHIVSQIKGWNNSLPEQMTLMQPGWHQCSDCHPLPSSVVFMGFLMKGQSSRFTVKIKLALTFFRINLASRRLTGREIPSISSLLGMVNAHLSHFKGGEEGEMDHLTFAYD